MPKQSARLGVKSTSITWSLRFKYSRKSAPTGASAANSIKPELSSPICNSVSAQSIPKDSTPRSLAFLILKSPGNTAPILAKGIFKPVRTLAAPQTTWKVSVPSDTWQTLSLSASGCCSLLTTSPTTTPLNWPATASIPSTSKPAIVSCAESSSVLIAELTHSRSHCSLNFIPVFLFTLPAPSSQLPAPSSQLPAPGHLSKLLQKLQIIFKKQT